MLSGCGRAILVSNSEILNLTKEWKEPKLAIWYYQGSDKTYHYFRYYDLLVSQQYKVKISELNKKQIIKYSNKNKNWRVMPWGPHASK